MRIRQEFAMQTSRQEVWDFLIDVNKVAACMPGVEDVQRLSEDRYKVQVSVSVGPIKAKFGGQVAVVDRQPPESMVIEADWKDRFTASKAKVRANLMLIEATSGGVVCQIVADVDIAGALGKYGHGVAQRKADELTGMFVDRMRAALEKVEPGQAADGRLDAG